MSVNMLPTLNATLNATSALLLMAGYFFIRRQKVQAHRACMGAAFGTSTLFLISYLTYHWIHGATRFPGVGWIRFLYLSILLSHTLLAILIVPIVIRTLYLALHARFQEHRRIARWTFPLWLYVSVTGVIVYWMLYQVNWAVGCPMCKEVVSNQQDPAAAARLISGFAWSLTLLLCTPYLLVGGITLLIARSAHLKKKTNAAG